MRSHWLPEHEREHVAMTFEYYKDGREGEVMFASTKLILDENWKVVAWVD